jgi:hypothetical protein
MFDIKDPLGFISDLIHQHRVDEWTFLIIQIVFTFTMAGCFVAGGALTAGTPPWRALGGGLVIAVTCTVRVWRKSQLTKGSIVVLPAEEAEKELDTNLQTIQKN